MRLSSGRRWPARVAVVGVHLAVFLLLWQHRPPPLPGAAERHLVTLRLLPLPERRPERRPERPPAQAARAQPTTPPITPRGPLGPLGPLEPAAPGPAPGLSKAPEPEPARPASPAPLAEPPRTALRLSLPPGYAASSAAARNPALSDPRSNTPRPTLEDRIADATGGASDWVEEKTSDNRLQSVGALGERRTVMRRGDTCVEIVRSRIAEMDQFNGNVVPRAVQMVGKPYKCR